MIETQGKNVLVLGAGVSGISAAKLAKKKGANVTICDSSSRDKLKSKVDEIINLGIGFIFGEDVINIDKKVELIIVSPGINLDSDFAKNILPLSKKVIGEIEFASYFSDIPIIAVTGTNGKTTVVNLISEVLNKASLFSIAAGNVGLSYSEVVFSEIHYDWIVLEISSFQLETIYKFKPDIIVWLNFDADHMDRYSSLSEYREAKERVFKNIDSETLVIKKLEEKINANLFAENLLTYSGFNKNSDYFYEHNFIKNNINNNKINTSEFQLQGLHNIENVMVACAISDKLKLDSNKVEKAIKEFKPIEHRCEYVRTIGGVKYINDSKSTNLHSLETALKGENSPIILIIGGKEKGLDYSKLSSLIVEKSKLVICIGEIKYKIKEKLSSLINCELASSLEKAVDISISKSLRGDVVLFSPGTSSFDMFSSYEERGKMFKKVVNDKKLC